ncbi:MAG TPA: hypothetical protein PK228_10010 [Saprospiraceae bacterium]|nr:hypothetical protein [Saprospiraceae bacterium]
MGTIQSSAVLFPSNKPVASLHVVEVLESKIAAAEAELNFYHKLLSWLLFSCHEEKRHAIVSFRKELADLQSGGLSALREGIERLKNEAQGEMRQSDLYSDTAHLQMYFNHTDGTFQSLKARIHRSFGDFTHVCIW